MEISFDTILERDMDLLFMQKFSQSKSFLNIFLKEIGYDQEKVTIESISHSVSTPDGESDIEVVFKVDSGKKVALLIENKINAPAMDNQAKRYHKRGEEAQKRGDYQEFHVFIVAPEKYLEGNTEAKSDNYTHKISYQALEGEFKEPYEKAVMETALRRSLRHIVRDPDEQITEFWNQLYDFRDERYPDINIQGKKGLERSSIPGQWITINCNNQFGIQIKSDRGYADLEIRNYADKFEQFSKDNKDLIDRNRLYIRTAGKALAVRKYIDCIDFSKPFDTQIEMLVAAFDAATELQDLIKKIKLR